MRVATVFTGVAAATVGMTQVANAQDAARPDVGPSSKHIGRAIGPAAADADSIRSAIACGANGSHPTWTHVSTTWYTGEGYEYTSLCFGFKGILYSPPFTGMRAVCGGNNHGALVGYYDDGGSWVLNFTPGRGYYKWDKSHLNNVTIYSWTGNDTCPKAPDYGGGAGG